MTHHLHNLRALFDVNSARDSIYKRWAQVAKTRPILFGAGVQGKRTLSILRSAGIEPLCFADETRAKQGSQENGLQILSLDESLLIAGSYPTVLICLFTPAHRYINTKNKILSRCRTATILPFFSTWLPCLEEDLECYFLSTPEEEATRLEVYGKLYAQFSDEKSRSTLLEHLSLRFYHDPSILPTLRTSVPFLSETLSERNLVYVDGGAYDGDTVKEFIVNSKGNFRYIYALEPDASNRKKMRLRFRNYPNDIVAKISILPKAVWRESCDIGFSNVGDMSSSIDDNSHKKVGAVSLSDLLDSTKDPIHIKLDVEGAELEALSGAEKLMNHSRPSWSISVYHKPNHLAEAYLYLSRNLHQYKFALRCHGGDGTDLVLYAW